MQLKKPGAPVCLGGIPGVMDLRTASPVYGGPEMSLYSAALYEIIRSLGIPFMGTAGTTEANSLDLQAAIESTIQVLLCGLSKQSIIHDVGFLSSAVIGSLEMLVMNDEIISMSRRIMDGIVVNDDTLMLDLIDEIGPGGQFIATRETAKQCRVEIWNPKLLDRDSLANWEKKGKQTMHHRVKTRLQAILAQHIPQPLPEGVPGKIEGILKDAERRVQDS
jgi:trimethylamine--corrinoid protein Co-methyltransferase